MAYAVPEGFQPTAQGETPSWMNVNMETGTATVDAADARKVFYNDLSDSESDYWWAQLKPQSLGAFASTSTYAAWRHIPSTHFLAEDDQSSLTPEIANMMILGARQLEPSAFDVVEKFNGGHCVMISQPKEVAEALRRAVGDVV